MTVVSLPARRAGLEGVEKSLPTNLTSTDTTERNAGMLRVPPRRIAGRACCWSWFPVVLVVVAVALGRLGPRDLDRLRRPLSLEPPWPLNTSPSFASYSLYST